MKQIILGSASPRRRELLQQIGVDFEVLVSQAKECYQSRIPQDIVKELALVKAQNVAGLLAKQTPVAGKDVSYVIIGADTIVVRDAQILGKPRDSEEAFEMLQSLQGRSHEVYTGVALLEYDGNGIQIHSSHAEKTRVFVHEMEEGEIRDYILTGEPLDKAGAYGIQGRFARYIDRIEGDYYNVVGLPVAYLYQQLKLLQEEPAE